MIKISSKDQCCGCSACLHVCPRTAISFKEDSEGFLYPQIDQSTCVDCGLCENVCPVINQSIEREPIAVYAAKHPDDRIRLSSSSGGIFTLLAESVIDEGGVVFGARFNENWEVVHSYTDTKEGLAPFRGSKYVQSNIGDSFVQIESFLKDGRKVMFTGTPCQVSGLKKYLRKEYDNLLTVDFICHGVPSPMVWHKYLKEEVTRQSGAVLTGVNFRNKSTGWKTYSLVMDFTEDINGSLKKYTLSTIFTDNVYMNAFLSNLSLRPSCYNCPAKSGKSGADITIGDFWGIGQVVGSIDDDKGTSILFDFHGYMSVPLHQKYNFVEVPFQDSISSNSSYYKSSDYHPNREKFFALINSDFAINKVIQYCQKLPLCFRAWRKAKTKFMEWGLLRDDK